VEFISIELMQDHLWKRRRCYWSSKKSFY